MAFVRLTLLAATALVCACSSPTPPVIDPGDPDTGPICEEAEKRCADSTLLICSADRRRWEELFCESGCEVDHCISPACTPLTAQCTQPKLLEVCDPNGNAILTVCDHGCINGECSDIVCVAGLTFCEPDGNKVQRCSVDGLTIDEVETCPYGCDGATASCKPAACGPDEVRCNPNIPLQIEKCNDTQTAFIAAKNADGNQVLCSEKCVDGHCFVSACQAGEQRCGANGVETCNSDGTAFQLSEECTWGCLTNGAEALCATCLPGAYACLDNSVVYCEAPYLPWTILKECKDIDTCAGGTCIKVLSLAGSPGANDVLLSLTEAIADCWLSMKAADKKEDVCRSLHSTGLDGDIGKGELEDWFCENADDTIKSDDFSEKDHFDAANDVMGCGLLSFNNLTINTPGNKVHGGLSQVECIGHEKNEIIIAPCVNFEN